MSDFSYQKGVFLTTLDREDKPSVQVIQIQNEPDSWEWAWPQGAISRNWVPNNNKEPHQGLFEEVEKLEAQLGLDREGAPKYSLCLVQRQDLDDDNPYKRTIVPLAHPFSLEQLLMVRVADDVMKLQRGAPPEEIHEDPPHLREPVTYWGELQRMATRGLISEDLVLSYLKEGIDADVQEALEEGTLEDFLKENAENYGPTLLLGVHATQDTGVSFYVNEECNTQGRPQFSYTQGVSCNTHGGVSGLGTYQTHQTEITLNVPEGAFHATIRPKTGRIYEGEPDGEQLVEFTNNHGGYDQDTFIRCLKITTSSPDPTFDKKQMYLLAPPDTPISEMLVLDWKGEVAPIPETESSLSARWVGSDAGWATEPSGSFVIGTPSPAGVNHLLYVRDDDIFILDSQGVSHRIVTDSGDTVAPEPKPVVKTAQATGSALLNGAQLAGANRLNALLSQTTRRLLIEAGMDPDMANSSLFDKSVKMLAPLVLHFACEHFGEAIPGAQAIQKGSEMAMQASTFEVLTPILNRMMPEVFAIREAAQELVESPVALPEAQQEDRIQETVEYDKTRDLQPENA